MLFYLCKFVGTRNAPINEILCYLNLSVFSLLKDIKLLLSPLWGKVYQYKKINHNPNNDPAT